MAHIALQQQTQWHIGRRDGTRQDNPNYLAVVLLDGDQEEFWTLPDHRAALHAQQLVLGV